MGKTVCGIIGLNQTEFFDAQPVMEKSEYPEYHLASTYMGFTNL